ncbi:hypothetical protein [Beijerinckia indica]|uniref:Uncharacterized protein n=1 Tax=Beijerinckia indica subsp. indica (strain ATCC 9039 / DSM 1715 / NCIMB 8712) TaxID=395963 RepID=B2IF33_BEII9|nr:hypothetical protein [Beijerinckia indica]ACB95598.1 hypothetical protein Bind_1975 [Beijerinckia indica subsp. indica ATCC 9039]
MSSITEILRNCSHEKVAQAAVASLGYAFARKVEAAACAKGMSIGRFTAETVGDFERHSDLQEKDALGQVMKRADQPILTGLHHILEPVLDQREAN